MAARRSFPAPAELPAREAKLAALDERFAAVMAAGAPHDFGTLEDPDPQTLQVATEANRVDWLVFDSAAQKAIALGAGDQPCTPPLRTTSNANRSVTWAEGSAIVAQMTVWGMQQRARYWAVKDAIAAAAEDELDAIDVDEGWG